MADGCGAPAVGSEHEFRTCERENTVASAAGVFLAAPSRGCTFEEDQRVCTLGDWSQWGGCPATCSAGRERVRHRKLVATTKLGVMEKEIAQLLASKISLEEAVSKLRRANITLREENGILASKLASSKVAVSHYQLQASQAYGLEDELAAERKSNDALRQQNGQLIEKVLASRQELDKDKSFITRLDRARDELKNQHSGLHGRLVQLQVEVDRLRQRNVALQTSNLALGSEADGMHATADRLRLALPVSIGVVCILALLGACCLFVLAKQLPPRQACPDMPCGSPERELSRTTSVHVADFRHVDSCGEYSPNSGIGSPTARSPFRGARGTLLSSPGSGSPKADPL